MSVEKLYITGIAHSVKGMVAAPVEDLTQTA
jgi:hypothetical protein